jgi:hypothetical protein
MRAAEKPPRVPDLSEISAQDELEATHVCALSVSVKQSLASTISNIKSFAPSVLQGHDSDGGATLLLFILRRSGKAIVITRERNLMAARAEFSHSGICRRVFAQFRPFSS